MTPAAGTPMHSLGMNVRRSLALLSVMALAVVAAGCGSSVPAGPDLTSFAPAASASAASDTGRFDLELEMSLPGTDKSFGLSASGGFDTPNQRTHFVFDMSALAKLMAGFGESLGGTVSGDLPTDPDAWQLEAIQDRDTIYVRMPLLAKELPAGKTWIKGDARELAAQTGSGLNGLGSLADTDPRDTFAYLKAVSGSIETVGGESVRGTDTTHYRATIDIAKVTAMLPKEQRQGLGSLDALFGQAGLSAIPLDVWLDAEQRVRKLELSVEMNDPGSDQQARASLKIEMYDYGKPLDAFLPPADEVVDVATLKKP